MLSFLTLAWCHYTTILSHCRVRFWDPDGPLSWSLLSPSICYANNAYLDASAQSQSNKQGLYLKLTGIQQAQVTNYAFCSWKQRGYSSLYKTLLCLNPRKFSQHIKNQLHMPPSWIENKQLEILKPVVKSYSKAYHLKRGQPLLLRWTGEGLHQGC